ncbi:bifunctional Ribosomal protein S10 domain superfamily/Ribosomal protein S10 domain [Babesia duncani]|uniref:Bifunctional Ribosomal protein S10 domain superfamily/Ribosomal protein S10 domain n=1 Tax=Babesia duncani TaxID=323732 RepID=A0AAD9PK25_9APIC|nr:bifunctional Ribosomal protein S10 domain superfamily/Ribosomal protein S10 domain [Babesia duncani]
MESHLGYYILKNIPLAQWHEMCMHSLSITLARRVLIIVTCSIIFQIQGTFISQGTSIHFNSHLKLSSLQGFLFYKPSVQAPRARCYSWFRGNSQDNNPEDVKLDRFACPKWSSSKAQTPSSKAPNDTNDAPDEPVIDRFSPDASRPYSIKNVANRFLQILSKVNPLKREQSYDKNNQETLNPFERERIISDKPRQDEELLRLPFISDEKEMKFSLDKWPENCFLRIRLVGYCPKDLDLAMKRIREGVLEYSNLKIAHAKAYPMKKKRWCILSSAHADKRSKDLYEIQEHVRVMDVFPCSNFSKANVDQGDNDATGASEKSLDSRHFKELLVIPLPNLVSFDYWFCEVYKPTKRKFIDELFNRKVWISKYYLHHKLKEEKTHIIDQLTSPEYINEVPLRWKRSKLDYYSYQITDLRRIFNFVRQRKSLDDARRKFNIQMPKLLDIDEVRFVANLQDRQYDEEMEDVDVLEEIEDLEDDVVLEQDS